MTWLKTIGRVIAAPVVIPAKAIQRKVERTMQSALAGVIRHLLTTLGGALVANGTLSADELSAAIGAVVTLVGIAWSIVSKRTAATTPAP